jgi:predicted TIM-barrel fold metal-dependent hydrolase
MVLDGHIHLMGRGKDTPADFRRKLKAAGIDGGIVISEPSHGRPGSLRQRLGKALAYARGDRNLFPFFWIEPMERDAERQVDQAIAMGTKGFKVIVTNYPPYHPKAMKVFRRIAARGKPILFHTGILWDGTASSINNRPANWECMLDIRGVRFATAHISWPWVDENIAVYGKIESANYRARGACEMFIDTTRGTPDIYRRDALFKVFKIGYRVERNVFFGTDCLVDRYDSPRAKKMVSDDTRILKALRVPPKVRAAYYADNLRRFVEG